MVTGRRLVVFSVFVLLLVGGWSFANNHPEPVTVDYWFGQWIAAPLWLVLISAFGAGAAFVGVLAALEMARMGLVSRRYRSAIKGLEEEVHQLRNLPLAADAEREEMGAGSAAADAGRAEGRVGPTAAGGAEAHP